MPMQKRNIVRLRSFVFSFDFCPYGAVGLGILIFASTIFEIDLALASDISRVEGLQCISAIRKMKSEAKGKDLIRESYFDSYIGLVMMSSPVGKMKSQEIENALNSTKENLGSCDKIEQGDALKFAVIEKWLKAEDRDEVPKKIFLCGIALRLMDQIGDQTGNKKIHIETESIGRKIGAVIGAFTDKHDMQGKMIRLLNAEAPPGRAPKNILETSKFKNLKKNCLILD